MKYLSIFVSALARFMKRIAHAIMFPFENMIAVRSSLRVEIIRAKGHKLTFGEWLSEMLNLLFRGNRHDYGVVSRNKVTAKGVEYIGKWLAAQYSGAAGLNYHIWGTSSTAESATDNNGCLSVAAETTGAPVVGVRSGAVVGNNYVFTSVATLVASEAVNITEHSIGWGSEFDMIGYNFDRSVFGVYALQIGDSIKFTYELTLQSGS